MLRSRRMAARRTRRLPARPSAGPLARPLARIPARLAAAALLLGLGGCTVGPDFSLPKLWPLGGWNDRSTREPAARPAEGAILAGVTVGTDPDPEWWRGFGDPQLTALVERAIAGNLDLQQAVLRITEAQQNEAAARAAGLPSLTGTASYTYQQLGLRGLLESHGAYGAVDGLRAPDSALNRYSPGLGDRVGAAGRDLLGEVTQPISLYQGALNASWELDLFGRVRRSVEQAGARTQASVEATRDGLVSLEAEVARNYATLRGAQALLASQRENVATAQGVLDLTRRRRQQGLTTELDVENARAQVETQQSQLPQYERQARLAMNRLAVLVGEPPGRLDAELAAAAPIPPTPPVVPVGLPATLARRRPDIRQAEANLHAATAGVGVAVAQFYPDISLTGSLGVRATDFSYLSNWSSHFYSIGPSISLPIFQGGRLTANLRVARAQAGEAALAYRAAVLRGLEESENALAAYRTDAQQRESLRRTVRAAETALQLARERYDHGLSSFIDVLDAQRTFLQSRQQLLQATLALTLDVVAIYRALGGGWEETAAPAPPPQRPVPHPDAILGVAGPPPGTAAPAGGVGGDAGVDARAGAGGDAGAGR
ncbi:efflux transporter outer membrane subunit [Roseomonas sp. NAR14]|uniref:Efflux transporter outer membrane subunit n=1 Tax=Roseomonas acroporae TaxID=2937791 RepID=A0A9X1YCZ5_9PROT|nr:efflux transporter outer membrane subunit [Roseomonas acroporae]MCK8786725.1 efflux transporter outer membrane subunit [Roseomonas acroporae]